MKHEQNSIKIEKDDLIGFCKIEGQKPEIYIKSVNKQGKEEMFRIEFEDHDTFEYFALKMHRIRGFFDNPRMKDRIDTARMKTILLSKELNKIKVRQ